MIGTSLEKFVEHPIVKILIQGAKIPTVAVPMSALLDEDFAKTAGIKWVFFAAVGAGMLDEIVRQRWKRYDYYTHIPLDLLIELFDNAISFGFSLSFLFGTPAQKLLPMLFIVSLYPVKLELAVYLNKHIKPRFFNQLLEAALRALAMLTLFSVINRTQQELPLIDRETQIIVFNTQLGLDLSMQALLFIFNPILKESVARLLNTFFELWSPTLLLFEVLMTVCVVMMSSDYFGNWLFAANAIIAGSIGLCRAIQQYYQKHDYYERTRHTEFEMVTLGHDLTEQLLPQHGRLETTVDDHGSEVSGDNALPGGDLVDSGNEGASADIKIVKEVTSQPEPKTAMERAKAFFYIPSFSQGPGFFSTVRDEAHVFAANLANQLKSLFVSPTP